MSFYGKVAIEKFNDYQYKVTRELSYKTKKGIVHTVPVGFITDGASIPKIFWTLVGSPFTGKYSPAALVHDFLYDTQPCTRSEADKLFLDMMQELGVKWWRRRAMYFAVRIGASWIWKRHKKELEK